MSALGAEPTLDRIYEYTPQLFDSLKVTNQPYRAKMRSTAKITVKSTVGHLYSDNT
jgi:hypothetical protein